MKQNMQISFVLLNRMKLSQLYIIHFHNVTFGRLLLLTATDCATGYYGTVQRVFGKVYQMKY